MSALPERMRAAAATKEEVFHRIGAPDPSRSSCTAEWLRRKADEFEAEDQAAAEREALVEQLTEEVCRSNHGAWLLSEGTRNTYRNIARAILARFDVTPKPIGAQEEQR